jgi:hypothetical protein
VKISEAIQALEDIKEMAGDLPLAGQIVRFSHPNSSGYSIYLPGSDVDITFDWGDDEAYVTMDWQDF